MISVLLATSMRMFYCPHEPEEGARARYRRWVQVGIDMWEIPKSATVNDVLKDPAYPHGWTMYSGPSPLSESDAQQGIADPAALLAELIENQTVGAIVVSDPDGTPWLVGLAEQGTTTE